VFFESSTDTVLAETEASTPIVPEPWASSIHSIVKTYFRIICLNDILPYYLRFSIWWSLISSTKIVHALLVTSIDAMIQWVFLTKFWSGLSRNVQWWIEASKTMDRRSVLHLTQQSTVIINSISTFITLHTFLISAQSSSVLFPLYFFWHISICNSRPTCSLRDNLT